MRQYSNIQIVLFVIMSLFSASLSAQTTVQANRIIAKDSIKIGSRWVYLVDRDSTFSAVSHRSVPTTKAMRDYVLAHSSPDNFTLTVSQSSHGFSVLDPVAKIGSTWILANVADEDSVHIGIVSQVISSNQFKVQFAGKLYKSAHGYTVGKPYFVQNDGTYALTVEDGFINDLAFTVLTPDTLFIHEQRSALPTIDLNGIYSGSGPVPPGTVAYANNFQIKDSLDKFIINVNPENDNMSLRGDSITMTFETDNGLVVIDQNTPKTGIRYAASGYVTNDLSLTTKEYVDDAVAGIVVHPEVTAIDGTTIDLTISPLQVLTAEVISNSITSSHIATGAVGSDEIATDAVGSAEIATSAVTTDEILDGTILTTDLAFTPLTGSGTLNYIPKWSSSTVLGNSSVQDDGVRVSFSSPFRMHNWTTAARPASPLSGDAGYNTSNNNVDVYNGTTWINYAQHSSGTGLGTSTRIPFYDANGRLNESTSLLWNYTSNYLQLGTTAGNAANQLNVTGSASILGNITLGYSTHSSSSTSRIRATRNGGSNPIIIACGAGAYFKIKGTSTESIQSAPTNYLYYPAIAGIGTAGSAIEIEALSTYTTALNGGLFISGINPNSHSQGFGCIGLGVQNSTPNSSYVQSLYGVFGRGQYILSAANAADTDMGSSALYLYGVYGDTRNNSNFTNGTVYGYGGYFVGDGTSYASPTGAIMNESYGIFVKGYGATQSWAVFSDEGTNWFEDEVRIGGTASTPTANVDIDGSLRLRAISTPASVEDGEMWTSSTQKAFTANQAGINQALVGVIFTGTANAATNNTNTDVSITPTGVGTLTLPANFFATGKQIKVTLSGNYTTDAVATPTLQLKLKAGSTTIATFSANTIPTKTSNGIFTAEFVVTCRTTGASGTVMGFGEMELNDTETTRDASWKTPATSTVTLDTTTSQALTVTAAFGTADADNSITVNQFSIEILN